MNTYVDRLNVKDRVDYETDRYHYISFTDNLFGWFGNVSVFDKKNCELVYHATIDKAYTLEELKVYAEGFEFGRKCTGDSECVDCWNEPLPDEYS